MEQIRQINATKVFLGVDGLSLRSGLTTPNLDIAVIERSMIQYTRGKVIAMADHSKFGLVAEVVVAPIHQIDIIVTDQKIPGGFQKDLKQLGVEVIVAKSNLVVCPSYRLIYVTAMSCKSEANIYPISTERWLAMTIRGLHPGLNQTAGIGLKMFSQDELEKIHLATLDVLWNVGVKVQSPEAVEIFHGSGCSVRQRCRERENSGPPGGRCYPVMPAQLQGLRAGCCQGLCV